MWTECRNNLSGVGRDVDPTMPTHQNDELMLFYRYHIFISIRFIFQELAEKSRMIDQLKKENEMVKKSQVQRVERLVFFLKEPMYRVFNY